MRIAFVTSEFVSENYFAGGLANYLYQITQALKTAGHDPEIFVSSNKNQDIVYKNIIVHRVKVDNQNLVNQSQLLNNRLKQIHQSHRFDIVQYSSWMAVGLKRIYSVPSVVRLSSFHKNKLEISALKRSDGVYSPSLVIATEVSKHLKQNIKVIETPYQTEIKRLDYSVYNKYLKNKRYLLFFGRLTTGKGIDEIVQIIYPLLKNNPGLYFVFIGDGSVGNIKKSAKVYADRVIYISPIRHQYLYPIIKKSLAVVLPSRVENLSNACIESMAHEKIVVGTAGASYDQLIIHGQNGFLVNIADPADLLSKINTILKLTKSKKTTIEKSAQKTIDRLQPKIIVQQLIKYYETLITKFSQQSTFQKLLSLFQKFALHIVFFWGF